jgi:hypothetical protein
VLSIHRFIWYLMIALGGGSFAAVFMLAGLVLYAIATGQLR